MTPFKMLEKGKAPTFLDSVFGNLVLRCLNSFIRMRLQPAAAGRVVVGDDAVVIDLTPMQAATQAAQIVALQKLAASQQAQINALIASLKTAQISCSGGNVVLILTKLP